MAPRFVQGFVLPLTSTPWRGTLPHSIWESQVAFETGQAYGGGLGNTCTVFPGRLLSLSF